MATTALDPSTISRSRFANRHLRSFETPDFERLKQSIQHSEATFSRSWSFRRQKAATSWCLAIGAIKPALSWGFPSSR